MVLSVYHLPHHPLCHSGTQVSEMKENKGIDVNPISFLILEHRDA